MHGKGHAAFSLAWRRRAIVDVFVSMMARGAGRKRFIPANGISGTRWK